MNGTLITSTPRGNMHPLAYQGILATDCHHQIVTILRSRLGDTHVLLFAEPAFDPTRDIVDWYTPVQGTPVRMLDLPPDRQDRVRATLLKMAVDIQAQARQLKATGDNNRILSGSIIELALHYPGDDCIYLVGEQPVIVCWGFGPAMAGAMPQDLSRLAPQSAPTPHPVASVSEPAPPGPKAGPTAGEAGPKPEPVPVAVAPSRRQWPWWLLGLLLLLVLLALLWRYRGWPGADRLAFLFPQPAVVAPAEEPGAEPAVGSELEAALAKREALRRELAELRAALVNKAAACRQPAPEDAAKHGQALEVPANAGQGTDLGFLQGVWRCDTDLSTPQDPVIVDYIFDASGKGQITVKTTRKICSAGVKASLDADGTLRIDSDPTIPCSSGNPIDGQRVECVGKGTQTTCTGVNKTSNSTWKAKFYKF